MYLCVSTRLLYLELFLQTIHLCSQGINYVLSMLQHKSLKLFRRLHLLNVLKPENTQMVMKDTYTSTDTQCDCSVRTLRI